MNFTEQVLDVLYRADSHDELWWRVDKGKVRLFISCSDAFYWATADLEEITEENMDILEQAYRDSEDSGGLLFCARVRGMRPQGATYKHLSSEEQALFDAVGPEREVDFWNPYTRTGEYAYRTGAGGAV